MAFIRVAAMCDLQEGRAIEGEAAGCPYAIIRIGGEVRAFDGCCPCTGGPLGFGTIRDGLLICPWHGWRFDVETGAMLYDETIRITRFPVKVEDGEIFIDIPGD